MLEYRFYLVDSGGSFFDVVCEHHPDDSAALAAATQSIPQRGSVEVWNGARFLGTVTAPQTASAKKNDVSSPVARLAGGARAEATWNRGKAGALAAH